MDRQERRKRARDDTKGYGAWKREAVAAVVGGVLAGFAVLLRGEGGLLDVVIIVVAGVAAAVLLPVGEYAWNYTWTPWRVLNERVEALYLQSKPKGDTAGQAKARAYRLTVFRRFENDMRSMKRGADRALAEDQASHFKRERESWRVFAGDVASWADLQDFYEVLRETYEAMDELNYFPNYGHMDPKDRERLEGFIGTLTPGLDAVQAQIAKYKK